MTFYVSIMRTFNSDIYLKELILKDKFQVEVPETTVWLSGEKRKRRLLYLHPKLSPGLVPNRHFLQSRHSMLENGVLDLCTYRYYKYMG